MATATIVGTGYVQNGVANLHVAVAGDSTSNGQAVSVEYVGRIALTLPLGARSSDGVYVDWTILSDADKAAAPNNGQSTVIANLTAPQRKAALVKAASDQRTAQQAGVTNLGVAGGPVTV